MTHPDRFKTPSHKFARRTAGRGKLCSGLTALMLGSWLLICTPALATPQDDLFAAAATGNFAQAEQALAQGAMRDQGHYDLEEGYDFVSPPIVLAAEAGQLKMVSWLLAHGAAVDSNYFHFSALHVAVDKRNLPLVKLRLEHKADPNLGLEEDSMGKAFYGSGGDTPLMAAIEHPDTLQFLLDHGADPRPNQERLFLRLVMARQTGLVQALIQHGASLSAVSEAGRKELVMRAKANKDQAILDMFKQQG